MSVLSRRALIAINAVIVLASAAGTLAAFANYRGLGCLSGLRGGLPCENALSALLAIAGLTIVASVPLFLLFIRRR